MKWEKLFRETDIAPLAVFRIFFGLLLSLETFGAIMTGWVKINLVDPKFTFSYIGFEWLQPLPGVGMYVYFSLMGLLGLAVMLGYRYRLSLFLFTVLWAGSYLMQKSSYNNHYYLLLLVCIIMLFLPANRYASLDIRQGRVAKSYTMPVWCRQVMVLQIAIVYFFAVLSKLYPGWLDGTFIRIMLEYSEFYMHFESLFSQHWFHLFLAWAGILFDLLVIPMLLYKRTRWIALCASLCFHLFNAVFLQIGIFPFFALSFALFFYPGQQVRRVFFRKEPVSKEAATVTESKSGGALIYYFFLPWFVIQLILPLRHHFIEGDVLWTEEGHRLSWRMMLRQRDGFLQYRVIDKKTNELLPYNLSEALTEKQFAFVRSKPDGVWQMARRIHAEFKAVGRDVAVYANCSVSVNEGPYKAFVDPAVDLAAAPFNYFGHSEWLLPEPADRPDEERTFY